MVNFITSLLGNILYPLFCILFDVIDLLQSIFKSFAGTGPVSINGNSITTGNSGEMNDSGIIYYLLQSNIVKNIFLSILMLAIILLVVFTVMAVLKNMYAPQPKKWQEIIGNAIKGLGLFIIVPACALLGVWLGNILLSAIDSATSVSSYETTLSRKLFISSAYNANMIRSSADDVTYNEYQKIKEMCDDAGITGIRTINEGETDSDYEYWASLVDDCVSAGVINIKDTTGILQGYRVSAYYHLWKINYLLLAVGGVFILYVLGAITFGMVKRMFMLVVLYVISPAVCAMYPIDEGNAYRSWVGKFKENVLSAYGAVAGMNLFFAIAPLIDQIELTDAGGLIGTIGTGIANDLLPLLLLIAGLYVVRDIISLISNFAGGGNAYSDGAGIMSNVKGKMQSASRKINSGAQILAHGTTSAFAAGKAAKDAGGNGLGAFFSSAATSIGKSALSGLNTVGKMGGLGLDIKGIIKARELPKDERSHIEAREKFKVAAEEGDPRSVMKAAKELGLEDKQTEKFFKGKADEFNESHSSEISAGTIKKKTAKDLREEWQQMSDGLDKTDELKLAATRRDDFRKLWDGSSLDDAEKARKKGMLGGVDAANLEMKAQSGGRDIQQMIVHGAKFSDSELDLKEVMKESGGLSTDEALERIEARRKVNDLSDTMNSRNNDVKTKGDELASAVGSAFSDTAFADAIKSAGLEGITQESIKTAISDAISQTSTSSLTNIDALITSVNKVAEVISGELVKSVKEGAKDTIRELKKNTEATASKKDDKKK